MSTTAHLIRNRAKIDINSIADRPANVSFEKAIREALGDLRGYRMAAATSVLLATYVAPGKTAGGIILTDKTREEDRWQCVVGLIIMMGPMAFKLDGAYEYTDEMLKQLNPPKVGDYVMFNTSDSREVGVRNMSCRIVDSSRIQMVVPNPDELY